MAWAATRPGPPPATSPAATTGCWWRRCPLRGRIMLMPHLSEQLRLADGGECPARRRQAPGGFRPGNGTARLALPPGRGCLREARHSAAPAEHRIHHLSPPGRPGEHSHQAVAIGRLPFASRPREHAAAEELPPGDRGRPAGDLRRSRLAYSAHDGLSAPARVHLRTEDRPMAVSHGGEPRIRVAGRVVESGLFPLGYGTWPERGPGGVGRAVGYDSGRRARRGHCLRTRAPRCACWNVPTRQPMLP